MPVTFRIDKSVGMAEVSALGVVTKKNLLTAYSALLSNPNFSEMTPCLVDFSEAEVLNVTIDDMQLMASLAEHRNARRGRARCALVAGDQIQMAFCQMTRQIGVASDHVPDIEAFESRQDALEWLGLADTEDPWSNVG